MTNKNGGKKSIKKYNLLFISTDFNYFIDNNASFNRMYNNLIYFHRHPDFNVIVLQPARDRDKENLNLKNNIKCYYFKEIRFFNLNFVPFIDFNLFYILKIKKIIKKHKIDLIHIDFIYGINCLRFLNRIPISYNAHNVETIYHHQVGKYYFRIPFFFRFLYPKYIYLLEKSAAKLVSNINAISHLDKANFIKLFNIAGEKVIINSVGYKEEIVNHPLKKDIARERLKIDEEKFVVIFHGSNMKANIEAVKIINERLSTQIKDKNILFLIAGNLPKIKNKSNLKFLGYIRDLKEFLYAADVAIVPVRRGSGINTKITDYISANIPIITTRKGAEGHLLKNGLHGYIIDEIVDDSIKKLIELKNNPQKINEFKENIKILKNVDYNWNKILKNIAKRYKFIIDSFK
ncbi:MAG: glycosyltransferase [Promethearchaeota archaeon]